MLNLIFDGVPNDNNMEQDFQSCINMLKKQLMVQLRPMNIEMFKI